MKRRVIKDRKKLVQVLIDQGWTPDDDGDFSGEGPHFTRGMWKSCGKQVTKTDYKMMHLYTVDGYDFMPEWTETI